MDRISDIRLFIRLAETLSFTETAAAVGASRASVGRSIERLEAALGTRLVQRTTRSVALTPDGCSFLEKAIRFLAEADTITEMFAAPAGPRGLLRVNVPSRMGRRLFAPRLPEFLEQYPEIELDLAATDRPVDLIGEGFDCVVRVGEQRISGLVSRTIARLRMINVASPSYIAANGAPEALDDLSAHRCVGYVSPRERRDQGWEWMEAGRPKTLRMPVAVKVNNAELYIACALAGLGLIQVPAYDVVDRIAAGELVEVLKDFPSEPMPVAIVAPERPSLSPTVAAFADWAEAVCRAAID
jgi:DNA-binding transcriptional LysR family regulator